MSLYCIVLVIKLYIIRDLKLLLGKHILITISNYVCSLVKKKPYELKEKIIIE
jgi:hypothetical protein